MRLIVIASIGLLAACQPPSANQAANKAAANVANNMTAAVAAKPMSRQAKLKLMHDRHEHMEKIGDAVKVANRALRSDSPDLQAIRTSAAMIAGNAPRARAWFPAGTGPDVGKTMAKPAIWQKPEDFAAKMVDFEAAARSFDAAAKSGDLPRIRGAFASLGKTCKACHDPYRTPHDH